MASIAYSCRRDSEEVATTIELTAQEELRKMCLLEPLEEER
jgi:hypothetical protein